jgi:hypothetical protein
LAALHEVPRVEEFAYVGGQLSLYRGESRAGRVCVIVWEGSASSAITAVYGDVSSNAALDLLSRFDLQDHRRARIATVTPRDRSASPLEDAPVLAKEVPDLGLIVVAPLTKKQARALPRWKGTSVRGGELFQDALGTPRMHFLIANQTSVATIMPKHSLLKGDTVPPALEEIEIAWE